MTKPLIVVRAGDGAAVHRANPRLFSESFWQYLNQEAAKSVRVDLSDWAVPGSVAASGPHGSCGYGFTAARIELGAASFDLVVLKGVTAKAFVAQVLAHEAVLRRTPDSRVQSEVFWHTVFLRTLIAA